MIYTYLKITVYTSKTMSAFLTRKLLLYNINLKAYNHSIVKIQQMLVKFSWQN